MAEKRVGPPKLSPDVQVLFEEFMGLVENRLAIGELEFDNAAFSMEFEKLLGETEEELLDLPGWSFFLWVKTVLFKKHAMVHLKEADKKLRREERRANHWREVATQLRKERKARGSA